MCKYVGHVMFVTIEEVTCISVILTGEGRLIDVTDAMENSLVYLSFSTGILLHFCSAETEEVRRLYIVDPLY